MSAAVEPPLFIPVERDIARHHRLQRQAERLFSVQDGPLQIRGQKGGSDEAGGIGGLHTLGLGDALQTGGFTGQELALPRFRPDQCGAQRGVNGRLMDRRLPLGSDGEALSAQT